MREAAERNVKDLRAGDPEEVEQAGQRTKGRKQKKTKERDKRERQKTNKHKVS